MSKAKITVIAALGTLILLIVGCMVVFFLIPVFYDIDYDIDSITPLTTDVRLLSANDPLNKSDSPALAKVKDGKISDEDFRILFLTDVHLSERKAPTRRIIERLVSWIEAEQPDLIILGGDSINGLNDRVRVKQFRDLMDRFGVYWAPVLGNHEGDRPILMTSRERVVEIWSESPLCLMESDTKKTADGTVVDGYGNYVVSILGESGMITDAFFFLDNGSKLMSRADYEKWGVNKKADTAISAAQVTWYQETYAEMAQANGGPLTHMCVIHKPLQIMGDVLSLPEEITVNEIVPWTFSARGVTEGWQLVYGELRDRMHYPPYTDGDLYKALVANHAKAVFFGHDHVNDLTLYNPTADIYLTYIRLGSYELTEAEGYNILTLDAKGDYAFDAHFADDTPMKTLFTSKSAS